MPGPMARSTSWKRFGSEDALQMARLTLDKMAMGGMYDHLGGGFHRYSTDQRWLVPHFEKMLYDNALLLRLYTDAFRAFGNDDDAATASDIGTYLLREMQESHGGFFAWASIKFPSVKLMCGYCARASRSGTS